MLGQVPHIHEGLAAHAALVRPNVVVVANVIGQLAGLDEPAAPQKEGLSPNGWSEVGGAGTRAGASRLLV